MVAKTQKPKKQKPAKVEKPKKLTIMSDELDKLKECKSLVERIEKCEAIVQQRRIDLEVAKEEAKNRKGALCSAQLELERLCRARKEKHPLFPAEDEKKPEKPAPVADVSAVSIMTVGKNEPGIPDAVEMSVKEIKPGGFLVAWQDKEHLLADSEVKVMAGQEVIDAARKPKEAKPANDGWKKLPLSDAGINGSAGKLLTEAGHDTLGKLAQLMHDHGQWWNKEVKGVGEEKAAEVADRLADFWKSHPEYCA